MFIQPEMDPPLSVKFNIESFLSGRFQHTLPWSFLALAHLLQLLSSPTLV